MRRLRREPAANLAANELRKAILTGVLPPGHRVKPEEIASKLGVSRMPVRQALSILEREGLVKTHNWHSTTVTPLDPSLILHIYDIREILERAVAAGVAQKSFDSSHIREIVVAGRHAASSGDITRMVDLDLNFHTTLYEAFGSRILSTVMAGLWGHVRRAAHAAVMSPAYREQIWHEHERIVDAIDARDPEKAAAVAGEHISNASRVAFSNLSATNGDESPSIDTPAHARPRRVAGRHL